MSRSKNNQGLIDAAYLKNEFLNRNDRYRVESDNLLDLMDQYYAKKASSDKVGARKALEKYRKFLPGYIKKWQLNPQQFSDHLDFDSPLIIQANEEGLRADLKPCVFPTVAQLRISKKKPSSTMKFSIDITKRKSRILHELSDILDVLQAKRAKSKERIRLDSYQVYLQVFDLHKKGLKLKEIVPLVYPREYAKVSQYGIEHLVERVRANLTSAKHMIEDGWKNL